MTFDQTRAVGVIFPAFFPHYFYELSLRNSINKLSLMYRYVYVLARERIHLLEHYREITTIPAIEVKGKTAHTETIVAQSIATLVGYNHNTRMR